ncbi:putative beta-lysine N-acetyltransferase [Brevibacillus migulae]|uniref:putative beta-lysine N-acetyltransferase n=1 Tax=Brevibacillus migulae TaxID=1644114 RepID=UPI00106DEC94|nr:putative beta-lysine N-acetyltransferase [Brevibacillus migulae]
MSIEQQISSGGIVMDPHNERIRVLSYEAEQIAELHEALAGIAQENGFDKIIIYAKKADCPDFLQRGYQQEGKIDGFFQGENAYMLSLFLSEERRLSRAPELAEANLRVSLQKAGEASKKALPDEYRMRAATPEDAEQLARLYHQVFSAYPTPMDDPAYVKKTMAEGTYYVVAEKGGEIACAASAEIAKAFGSAELTDCATHPAHAGKGLLQPLFHTLEEHLEKQGIYYLYTLTRAQSAAMNITAAKQGFQYRGRLINNCIIATGFEDMNIWVKPLRPVWE